MRRRWKILLVAVGGVLVLGGYLWLHDDEPSYNGHGLGEWLDLYYTYRFSDVMTYREHTLRSIGSQNDAENAVRSIGTNAIPLLLKWSCVKKRDEPSVADQIREKIPLRFMPDWYRRREVLRPTVHDYWWRAEHGFQILGTNAVSAVPELAKQFQSENEDDVENASRSLAWLGDPGLRVLIGGLTNGTGDHQQWEAIERIKDMGEMGTNRVIAVPALVQLLRGKDDSRASEAAQALGTFTEFPDKVVLPLMEAIRDGGHNTRESAVRALGHFETNAKPAADVVLKAVTDPDQHVRAAALIALRRIVPEVYDTRTRK